LHDLFEFDEIVSISAINMPEFMNILESLDYNA